jgi:FAD/FMN-containing dehydrogenase
VEFGSNDPGEADEAARQLIGQLKRSAILPTRASTRKRSAPRLEVARGRPARGRRRSGRSPPEWEGWDDAAVPPEKLGNYLRDIRKLLDEYITTRRSTAISDTAAFTCA